MGVRVNRELCTPARLASHSVAEGRSGNQISASAVSIDDHQGCLGRKNQTLASMPAILIPAYRYPCQISAKKLAGRQLLGSSASPCSAYSCKPTFKPLPFNHLLSHR